MYSYNGKELYSDFSDSYSGVYDFGARYNNPLYGRWFAHDPAKQGINPYVYCGNNPVMSVDPDGRKVIPNGSRRLQSMFLEQLQSYVSKDLELFQNDNGSLSYTMIRPYKKLRSDSKKLIDAIDSEDIAVNVLLKVIETFSDASMIGGAFMGNIYNESTGKVQTYQGIDPQFMEYFDAAMEAPGAGSIHEVIESYEGGIMAIEQGRSIPNSNIDEESYAKAHRKSTYVPNIKYDYLDKSGNILDEGVNASSIKFYYRLSVATGSVDVLYIITMPYKYK